VRAIFISHEHSDHIKGVTIISKKYQLPVYITEDTHKQARLYLEKVLIRRFNEDKPIQIGELCITAFQKFHDAGDPHSFTVASPSVKVGVFTDLGKPCKKLIKHFKQCHAAFLEANYDTNMLMNGDYPYFLKKRISDGLGHLSNKEALDLYMKHRPDFMSHLILSHLSKNNNSPKLVKKIFEEHNCNTEIIIASRDEESELFTIQSGTSVIRKVKKAKSKNELQLSLF
jgi:phosphoribosyl 1,2-cyclic phosphodiesterase